MVGRTSVVRIASALPLDLCQQCLRHVVVQKGELTYWPHECQRMQRPCLRDVLYRPHLILVVRTCAVSIGHFRHNLLLHCYRGGGHY
jgi:hypothetical protein